MGALALGTEKPKPVLLERMPFGKHSSLISKIMYRNIIGQAIFQFVILMIFMYKGRDWFEYEMSYMQLHENTGVNGIPPVYSRLFDEDKLYTFIFNTFVWLQVTYACVPKTLLPLS